MRSSDKFEIRVFHIHELLNRSSGEVTWNDHISDPDNPKQLRQIDVTVRKDGVLTLIECRETKSAQNVKWIEELIGRKQSLKADTVIGVSSSGFTSGAQRKASAYGIMLHTLQNVTDADVAQWAGHITLTAFYYQYSNLMFSLGFRSEHLPRVTPETVVEELKTHPLVQHGFNEAAYQLGTLNLLANKDEREVRFGVRCGFEDIYLAGTPVIEMGLEGVACLRSMPVLLPKKCLYKELTPGANGQMVILESSQIGETSVARQHNRISINLDLSAINVPPLCQVRYIRTQSNEELEYEVFAITNPDQLRVTGSLDVKLYTT